jgi:hypothetical protein
LEVEVTLVQGNRSDFELDGGEEAGGIATFKVPSQLKGARGSVERPDQDPALRVEPEGARNPSKGALEGLHPNLHHLDRIFAIREHDPERIAPAVPVVERGRVGQRMKRPLRGPEEEAIGPAV